jgi:hypothetical protein
MPQSSAFRVVEDVHEGRRRTECRSAEWIGLCVLTLPTILIGLASTILHLAVPRLSVDVHPNGSQLL